MLKPKTGTSRDDSTTIAAPVENHFGGSKGKPLVGWNIGNGDDKLPDNPLTSYLTEIQLSHNQITKRFAELLNLFEDYTKLLDNENEHHLGAPFRLRRVRSEQLVLKEEAENMQQRASSLTQLSDITIKPTCEVSSQTSWTAVDQRQVDCWDLEPKLAALNEGIDSETEKPSNVLQHTIHIEVESVTSATDMQRPPLRQRMWNVLVQTGDTMIACAYMIGENLTIVLFIALCLWCLYLLLSHFYSSLQTNVSQQIDLKRNLMRSVQAK
ncbi:uncharacterized protein LOC108105806 [Drosophila eugracilis]|uniref:uncharacterized protein LOC108105806 n=1 Tax=Drosophila eugracilis TaxID=29029 RepID=UPI0007E741A0|nr:uncharacterized protein LOC108105806 [Drosophila eugracilis]